MACLEPAELDSLFLQSSLQSSIADTIVPSRLEWGGFHHELTLSF